VIKLGCSNISINSSILMGSSPDDIADTSIRLPATIFGTMSDCDDVGVIVVIYDGAGPLLSNETLIPECKQPPEPLVHGRW